MDPVTSGWLLATFCATAKRPVLGDWYEECSKLMSPDRVVSEPYKSGAPTTRPPASYTARSESIKRLRELRSFEPGWDGDSAAPPSETALAAAEAFIQMLPAGLESPRIGLAADGELGFFWEGEDLFVDLSFADDGSLSYYAKIGDSEHGGDDIELGSEAFKKLISVLPWATHVRMAA